MLFLLIFGDRHLASERLARVCKRYFLRDKGLRVIQIVTPEDPAQVMNSCTRPSGICVSLSRTNKVGAA